MNVTLTAETGRTSGSRSARRLRREGRIPGVVYGLGGESQAVSVDWPDLRAALTTEAGLNALIRLDVDGVEALTIVKELQRDPVRRAVAHVDFLRIDPDADIEVEVPVTLVGEARQVELDGGLVDQLLYNLQITSKPESIPTEITVDLEPLTLDTAIKVADIVLPAGVSTDVDPEEPVVTAFLPRAEVAAEEAEGEAGVEGEGEEGETAEGEAESGGGDAGGDEAESSES